MPSRHNTYSSASLDEAGEGRVLNPLTQFAPLRARNHIFFVTHVVYYQQVSSSSEDWAWDARSQHGGVRIRLVFALHEPLFLGHAFHRVQFYLREHSGVVRIGTKGVAHGHRP